MKKVVNQAKIQRLVKSEDSGKRKIAAEELKINFSNFTNKKQAWEYLHKLTFDNDSSVREDAAYALGNIFLHLPDKKQAWNDLIRLTFDTDDKVRKFASDALEIVFSHVPDKKQAWNDLIRLATFHFDWSVRWGAADALGSAFLEVPAKKRAWSDLIRLTSEKYVDRRTWDDMIWLTISNFDWYVRWIADDALGNVFARAPFVNFVKLDKYEKLRLILENDRNVRKIAAYVLGDVFSHMPDKKLGWEDLQKLTSDTDNYVRWGAAFSLGSAFSDVPDKQQAWEYMKRLTSDKIRVVRVSAYNSMGKASIFKAANAENDIEFKREIEEAIGYFEKSSQQAQKKGLPEPAKFCLPFYRSFYILTFKKEEAEAEVQKYLAEAKSAVGKSRSKETLLEAVENIGNALKEAQKAQKAQDFDALKCTFNAYKQYCEHACDLLESAEGTAPNSTQLVRKGLPIIDGRIKGILREIQEKTKALYRQTQGTTYEELGNNVYFIGQNLLIANPIELEKRMNNLQISLSAICGRSDSNVVEACQLLKKANDENLLENRIQLMDEALSKILPHIGNVTKIDINKSKNIQISTAEKTTQKMSIGIPEEKNTQRKHGFLDFINISAGAATISGFGTYVISETMDIIPVIDYKHQINAALAIIMFFIVLFIARKYFTKSH